MSEKNPLKRSDTDPVPLKHRPDDSDSEDEPQQQQQLPGMRTLQAHTGADVEAGRVGHRNGEVPLDDEEEDAPDIRLQPPAKKQGHATQKDTRAGAEPAKRKRAAAPVAAAPAAAGGLAAFGFGGAAVAEAAQALLTRWPFVRSCSCSRVR